jgi:steroid delta-isomerase-like uncharacterized protein
VSTEDNKALVRRFYDDLNTLKLEAFDQYCAPDFVDHGLPPGVPRTLEGAKMFVGMLYKAFPDIHLTVEEMIAERDKVVSYVWLSGTHQGEFQGMPPTGKHVKIELIDMHRITGGKVVDRWGVFDALGMMQQLGAIPAPGQSGH